MKNLVVFASGSGSNFQSIIDAVSQGKLEADVVGLVCNNDSAFALERARKSGIPAFIISPDEFENESDYSKALLIKLKEWNADLLVLAGYLKKIPEVIIHSFDKRILNIHPSLLPKYGGKGFYGSKVHEAVIRNQESQSGCTVHIVTAEYDEGPVIGQSTVQVSESDNVASLAQKVLEEEHVLFPETIQKYLTTLKIK
ncbi:MAG: phosphoribosylglycinamide formyltransferase [Balneola sp.]